MLCDVKKVWIQLLFTSGNILVWQSKIKECHLPHFRTHTMPPHRDRQLWDFHLQLRLINGLHTFNWKISLKTNYQLRLLQQKSWKITGWSVMTFLHWQGLKCSHCAKIIFHLVWFWPHCALTTQFVMKRVLERWEGAHYKLLLSTHHSDLSYFVSILYLAL